MTVESFSTAFDLHSGAKMHDKNVAFDLETQLFDLRMAEINLRKQMLFHLRQAHKSKLWRELGTQSFAQFCTEGLGYSRTETREIFIDLELILPSSRLVSDNPSVQRRIDTLVSWRRLQSDRRNCAPYRVITNRTLLIVAEQNALSVDDLKRIPGIGPKKIGEFGDEIIVHHRISPHFQISRIC
jgi:superfamily II DNA helicase RecQ